MNAGAVSTPRGEEPDGGERDADLAGWVEAGLLDLDDVGAAGRVELLHYLASLGVETPAMIEADSKGQLVAAAADKVLFAGGRLRIDELAARAGVPVERIAALWRVAGLAPPASDKAAFADDDVDLVRMFEMAVALFGEDAAVQITRVIGSAVARVVDASASLFLANVEGPLVAGGGSTVELAAANVAASEMLLGIPTVVDRLFRHHAQVAIRRSRLGRDVDMPYTSARMAVAFVDLVGFTERSQHLDPADLSSALSRFESAAYEAVASEIGNDGRVVKSIGDEVLFVALDAAAACRAALLLCQTVEIDPFLGSARGCVGAGLILTRDGDVYGPVVNVASRAVKLADPGSVLATQAVVESLDPEVSSSHGLSWTPIGPRSLRGVDGPVELVELNPLPPAP